MKDRGVASKGEVVVWQSKRQTLGRETLARIPALAVQHPVTLGKSLNLPLPQSTWRPSWVISVLYKSTIQYNTTTQEGEGKRASNNVGKTGQATTLEGAGWTGQAIIREEGRRDGTSNNVGGEVRGQVTKRKQQGKQQCGRTESDVEGKRGSET